VDKHGQTIDFLLTEHRDKEAALRFLKKAIRRNGVPETITIDGSDANEAAIKSYNQEYGTALEGTPRQRACRWWGHRDLATDGRPTTFYPRLPKTQSFTNYAWLTIPAEPTPDQLLDSSFAARLATGLRRSRAGAGA
jgi:transposase-like protein